MREQWFCLQISILVLAGGSVTALHCHASDAADLPSKTAEAAEWFVETIDDTTNVGPHLSVAYMEKNQRVFISYQNSVNGALRLAESLYPAGSSVGGNCGPDNTWGCFDLFIDGDASLYNDIAAVDWQSNIRVAIGYYDPNDYALRILVGWIGYESNAIALDRFTIETGDPPSNLWVGKYTSVALDTDGDPIIAYQKGNESGSIDEDMMVARPAAVADTGNCGEGDLLNDWQCDSLHSGEGAGQYASIDLDSSDNPTVAFYDPASGSPVVATEVGAGGNCGPTNSWSCTTVTNGADDTGRFLSLAVEADGTPHLAYYNATDETLEYATFVATGGNCGGSEWQCNWITDMGTSLVDMGVSIDLTPEGIPIIAYQDASSVLGPATLAIARPHSLLPDSTPNCGPVGFFPFTWVCEWLDSGGATLSEARAVSLTVSEIGQAMVAYHELNSHPYPVEGAAKFTYEPRPLIFSDDFESGTFESWSAVVTSTEP